MKIGFAWGFIFDIVKAEVLKNSASAHFLRKSIRLLSLLLNFNYEGIPEMLLIRLLFALIAPFIVVRYLL